MVTRVDNRACSALVRFVLNNVIRNWRPAEIVERRGYLHKRKVGRDKVVQRPVQPRAWLIVHLPPTRFPGKTIIPPIVCPAALEAFSSSSGIRPPRVDGGDQVFGALYGPVAAQFSQEGEGSGGGALRSRWAGVDAPLLGPGHVAQGGCLATILVPATGETGPRSISPSLAEQRWPTWATASASARSVHRVAFRSVEQVRADVQAAFRSAAWVRAAVRVA